MYFKIAVIEAFNFANKSLYLGNQYATFQQNKLKMYSCPRGKSPSALADHIGSRKPSTKTQNANF